MSNSSEVFINGGTSTVFSYVNTENPVTIFFDDNEEKSSSPANEGKLVFDDADSIFSDEEEELTCAYEFEANKIGKSEEHAYLRLLDHHTIINAEQCEGGKRFTLQHKEPSDRGVFIIKDVAREYFNGKEKYISNEPYVTQVIYALLETSASSKDLPAYSIKQIGSDSKGRGRFMLKVEGTKEEIIRFADAMIEIVNKQSIKLAVHI